MNAGDRLRALRTEAGLSTSELGKRAAMVLGRDKPLHPSTVRNQENAINGISPEVAGAYATVLGRQLGREVSASDILFGDGHASTSGVTEADDVRMVGIIGEVNAGAFMAMPESDEPTEYMPVRLPAYAQAHLFGLLVVGRSMDRYYPDGTAVVICPVHEAGIRMGDHVVVRMHRNGLVETTLKEITVENGVVTLWPRSTDPEHQDPIALRGDRDSDNGPEIIGVVVGYSNQTKRQGLPIAL